MGLEEKLLSDQNQAVKQGERLKTSVLRLLRAEIHNREIEQGSPLDDAAIHSVISKEIKRREESLELFRRGGRQDLVDKEEAEVVILKSYLPPQLGREDIHQAALQVIKETGASGPRDKGKVMGKLMPQLRGKAEGKAISEVVDELLSGSP